MAFADSFKKLIGISEDENYDEFTDEELAEARQEIEEEESEEERERAPYRRPSLFARSEPDKEPKTTPEYDLIRTLTGQQTVIMIEPDNFDECPKLVDSLKGRRAVIINLEKVETETARKIFDFLSGATYALNGTAKRITNNIFIFAPENVNIAQTEERNTDFGIQKNIWNR